MDMKRPQQSIAILFVTVLLAWPGRRSANRWGERPGWFVPAIGPVQRRAAPLAAVSVVGFA